MSKHNLSTQYTTTSKPSLLVHFTKYKQFWGYELNRNWKTRTVLLVIFLATLFLFWRIYYIQQPHINKQQTQYFTSADLYQNIETLDQQLNALKRMDSDKRLEKLQRHILKDYTSISLLLEQASTLALQHKFIFTYTLNPPVSKSLKYFNNLAAMGMRFTLTPLPKVTDKQVWFNLMQYMHTMFEADGRYQLSSVHITSGNNHINKVTLEASVLTQLENWKNKERQ